MEYIFAENAEQLEVLCDQIAKSRLLAFDTEFVAEDSYKPDLCLIQVATEDLLAIIDPTTIADVTPFWELVIDPERTVIAHAGREEILFCYRATGSLIPNLFDVQLAAGFVGMEYPAAYGKLVHRMLGITVDKGETRTDWRTRPLSKRQLDYAILDVAYLPEIFEKLSKQLAKLRRSEWFVEETQSRQSDLAATETVDQWHRMSGMQSLSAKHLTIARELWRWRELRAERRNQPPRRILRDDLIIELSRRATADARRISQVRGMNHRGLEHVLPEIGDCIAAALKMPGTDFPRQDAKGLGQPPPLLTQYLNVALSHVCKAQQIAAQIVGTSDDLREWALYRLKGRESTPAPSLATGWRAEIIGETLDRILSGEIGLRVSQPRSDDPLDLVDLSDSTIDSLLDS